MYYFFPKNGIFPDMNCYFSFYSFVKVLTLSKDVFSGDLFANLILYTCVEKTSRKKSTV